MAPYNNAIPQPNDFIDDSQNDLLNNFASIQTLVDVNHVTFDAAGQGKHKFLQMPQQVAAPATALAETALVTLSSAYNANGPELVYRRESNGAQIETTASLQAILGWTFIPSGLLLKWGRFQVNALGAGTFPFPLGATIPAFNSFFSGYLQVFSSNANTDPNISVSLNVNTTNNLTLAYNVVARNTAVATTLPTFVYYFVIGN